MGTRQLFSNDMTDEALCHLASTGRRDAEEELVLRYNRTVRICARPLFLAGGDSEDLMQEGLLGLLRAIREFDPERESSFRTFAEVCIRNRMLSAVKAASRDKHAPLNNYVSLEAPCFDGFTIHDACGTDYRRTENPEDTLISREEASECMRVLRGRLSDFEVEVLDLYLDGYSYAEIAEELDRPVKSVDNAVQRIRHKL